MTPEKQILFGIGRYQWALITLPTPPWPWYFEWVDSGTHGPHEWDYWLYLKRLDLPETHPLARETLGQEKG